MAKVLVVEDPQVLDELRKKKPWELIGDALEDYGKQVWQQAMSEPSPVRQAEMAKTAEEAALEAVPLASGGLKTAAAAVKGSKVGQVLGKVKDAFLSPGVVLSRSVPGKNIYDRVVQAENETMKFVREHLGPFLSMQKETGIDRGSFGAQNVARALDGKLDPGKLAPTERKMYEFLKGEFDFLINRRATQLAGGSDEYKQVAAWASSSRLPVSEPKNMISANKDKYTDLVKKAYLIRRGRPFDQLTQQELQTYNGIKAQIEQLRHKDWLTQLPQGQKDAYVLLKSKLSQYLPHMFDKQALLADFEKELQTVYKKISLMPQGKALEQLKKRAQVLEGSVQTLKGGGLVSYQGLPQSVRFKFFEPRKGKPGYELDAVKAYESYLVGLAKKMYHEPALKEVAEEFKNLPPEQRDYARWFVENWKGLRRGTGKELADWVTSSQWMLKLGMNPRSAIYNMFQQVNTIADVGEKAALKGYAKGMTREGQELFDKTGLAFEVPSVMLEGEVPERLERVKKLMGWMFAKVELANRKHAFLSGYEKAKAKGMSDAEAVKFGIDTVHRTQFVYGKLGSSQAASTPVGRVALQFTSYPIKQMEFLYQLAHKNPVGLARWMAYSQGAVEGAKALGMEVSSGLGLGVQWGEAVKALGALSEGDWERFKRQVKVAYPGGGLIPTSPGPAVVGALQWWDAVGEGRGLQELGRQLTPVQMQKIGKLFKAIEHKKKMKNGEFKYPVFDRRDNRTMELSFWELMSEVFGPRTVEGAKQWKQWKLDTEKRKEYVRLQEQVVSALIDRDVKKASKILREHGIEVEGEALENEVIRRSLTSELRRSMETGKMADWVRRRK